MPICPSLAPNLSPCAIGRYSTSARLRMGFAMAASASIPLNRRVFSFHRSANVFHGGDAEAIHREPDCGGTRGAGSAGDSRARVWVEANEGDHPAEGR